MTPNSLTRVGFLQLLLLLFSIGVFLSGYAAPVKDTLALATQCEMCASNEYRQQGQKNLVATKVIQADPKLFTTATQTWPEHSRKRHNPNALPKRDGDVGFDRDHGKAANLLSPRDPDYEPPPDPHFTHVVDYKHKDGPIPALAAYEFPADFHWACEPAPTEDFRHSHEGAVRRAARQFCKDFNRTEPVDRPVQLWQLIKKAPMKWGAFDHGLLGEQLFDDTYNISIVSIPNCQPGEGVFNLAMPKPGYHCMPLVEQAWRRCSGNKGRGGSVVAGCLRYRIKTQL